MRNQLVILLFVVILIVVGVSVFYSSPKGITLITSPSPVACTQEAMICPDGSSVGRTGPSCAFAACPGVSKSPVVSASPTPAATTFGTQVKLKQLVKIGDIFVTPLEINQDSRCPVDVQCIQAGTVKVETILNKDNTTQTSILTLGTPLQFFGYTVTLQSVAPDRNSKTTILPSDYVFTFSVVKNQ